MNSDFEILKVRTEDRLYLGAKIDVGPRAVTQDSILRVVREDAAKTTYDSAGRATHVSIVEVRPSMICVGDWIIKAEVVPESIVCPDCSGSGIGALYSEHEYTCRRCLGHGTVR